jgi:hypothetical protein
MWNVPPKLLCNQHLLGEHCEMHMFVGCINKGVSVGGYIESGLVEVHNIKKRHTALAKEMTKRGMNHTSKLPYFVSWRAGEVDKIVNVEELAKRCEKCEERIKGYEVR